MSGRRRALGAGVLWLVATAVPAAATEFRELVVDLDHGVEGAPVAMRLAVGAGLLAVGPADGGWRYSVVSLTDGRVIAAGAVPEGAFFYDAGDAVGLGRDQACFLDERGVVGIEPVDGTLRRLASITSVYRGRPALGPVRSDFLRDVDGDGLDDLLLPQFDGWLVARRGDDGLERHLLSMPPRVVVGESRISYQPREPRIGDVNGDGLSDVVFLRDREFVSFVQTAEGGYAAAPRIDAIEAPLATEAQRARWEREDGQVDQSELEIEEVEAVRDFDGDGVLDLLAERTISEGLFDRRSEYHLYLGRREGALLRYPATPNGSIVTDGVQFDPLVTDLDSDGRLDVATPSTKLGLTRVVGALFSGRIGVDLNVYRLGADGGFAADPDYSTRFKVEFDLKTGLFRYPAVAIADVDGDGHSELLVQEEPDVLTLYPGIDGPALFDGDGRERSLPLPRNGQMLQAEDLDGDGRADLLVRYGPADGPDRHRQLRVLLSGDAG